MKLSALLMMGVAFTLGLVIGLLLHLPGIVAPSGRLKDSGHIRHARQLAQAPDWHETLRLVNYPTDSDISSLLYDTKGNQRKVNASNSVKYSGELHLRGNGEHRLDKMNVSDGSVIQAGEDRHQASADSVSALQDKIKQIHNSIHVLKSDTELKQTNVLNAQQNEQTPPSELHIPGGLQKPLKEKKAYKYIPRRVLGGKTASVKVYKRQDKGGKKGVEGQTGVGKILMNDVTGSDRKRSSTDLRISLQASHAGDELKEQFVTLSDIVQGVYWSPKMETFASTGFTDSQIKSWRKQVEEGRVWDMKEGCGRMQNRLVVLGDSVKACARYRINTDQMQGEIYSYYLGRLLGIHNIPPSILVIPDMTDPKWNIVIDAIRSAQWSSEKVAILTPWLESLQPTYIPRELRTNSKIIHNSMDLIHNRTVDDLLDLVQWSDLIIFDYLTANVDRVVNNMYNLQWNHDMMSNPAHNLEKSTKTNSLVFFDNESGLFHSYRLLDKYSDYHETLLHSLCIFKKSTADAIEIFYKTKSIGSELQKLYEKEEPLHGVLPRISERNVHTLQSRVDSVYNQIQSCKATYRT